MDETTRKLLDWSINTTVRDMARLRALPVDGFTMEDLSYSNVFLIDSYSPKESSLQFYFPLELKKLVVEKILEQPWTNLSHQYIDDCLLELVNIIGGNFYCRYFGSQPYEIGLPHMAFDNRGLSTGEQYFFKTSDILFSVTMVKDE